MARGFDIAGRIAGAIFALVLFAAPVHAEFYANDKAARDPNRAFIETLAKDLQSIPASFGCELAWGHMDENSVQIEFVPKGDDVRKWTRLVTMTLVSLPPQPAGKVETTKRLQAIMTDNFNQRGRVIESKSGADKNGTPTLYVEYKIGTGAAEEHNAAIVMMLRPDWAGVVQIQAREKPLAREDAARMKALAISNTQN